MAQGTKDGAVNGCEDASFRYDSEEEKYEQAKKECEMQTEGMDPFEKYIETEKTKNNLEEKLENTKKSGTVTISTSAWTMTRRKTAQSQKGKNAAKAFWKAAVKKILFARRILRR